MVQLFQNGVDLLAMGVEVTYDACVQTQLNVAESIGRFSKRYVPRKVLERPAVRPTTARNHVAGF